MNYRPNEPNWLKVWRHKMVSMNEVELFSGVVYTSTDFIERHYRHFKSFFYAFPIHLTQWLSKNIFLCSVDKKWHDADQATLIRLQKSYVRAFIFFRCDYMLSGHPFLHETFLPFHKRCSPIQTWGVSTQSRNACYFYKERKDCGYFQQEPRAHDEKQPKMPNMPESLENSVILHTISFLYC